MRRREKIIAFLVKPPLWLCIAVWAVGAVSLAGSVTLYFFGLGLKAWALPVHIVTLLFFVLSVYAVTAVIGLPERVKRSAGVRSFFSSWNTRMFVYAAFSVLLNLGYVVFGGILAYAERSVWMGVLVGYHVFLFLSRAIVLYVGKYKARSGDAQRHRLRAHAHCGFSLVLLSLAFIPVIRMTLADENTYRYFVSAVIYVSAIAAYTFIKFGTAMHSFYKARKQDDHAVIAVKNVSLADALISLFTLQALMLKELGPGSAALGCKLNPVTGATVVILILSMGLGMMITGVHKLKGLNATGAAADGTAEVKEDE